MLLQPETTAKHRRPARVEILPAAAGVTTQPPRPNVTVELAEPGSAERWQQLQGLRRRQRDVDLWLERLVSAPGDLEPDLLAALVPVLDRARVERLLAGPPGRDPLGVLQAVQQQWPSLAAESAVQQAWLEPLLRHSAQALLPQRLGWLQLLGLFRDPRVAALLRQALEGAEQTEAAWTLLPLLGWQRHPQDAVLLQRLALEAGPQARRHQALEGVALGLSAWPQAALCRALTTLASDLDGALASKAIDLLARMPAAAAALRPCLTQALAPEVRQRLHRRLSCSPLVLLVHGRRGGEIPQELEDLAAELARRRGAPVLLQALTAAAPQAQPELWRAAQRAAAVTLVPLLLLPGGHVRTDLPMIAAHWRAVARTQGVALRRRAFLGAWPAWQQALAAAFRRQRVKTGRRGMWLHHPLEGVLAGRFVAHLTRVLGAPALSATYSDPMASLREDHGGALLLPLTLAANRLSESLESALPHPAVGPDQPEALPPLLHWPPLHRVVLDALTLLP